MYSSPLSSADKEECGLAAGDEYTISFTITSTVSGSITVNGNVVEIIQGETEVNVKSTYNYEEGGQWYEDASYTDGGYWGTYATLRIQLGADGVGFLGASEIAISGLEIAKYLPAEGTESITASGLSNVNGVEGETDGLMHYWTDTATVTEAVHDLTEDT